MIRHRCATADDIDALRAIARAAYAPFVEAIGREPPPMIADFEVALRDDAILVAESDGDVVGFAHFRLDPDRLFVVNLAVRSDRQRAGCGRALLDSLVGRAREERKPRLELYTNAAMTGARSLYRRYGFEESGRRREEGLDRVYFHLELDRQREASAPSTVA